MPYRKFTLSKAVEDFQLTIIEGDRFLPEVSPVNLAVPKQDIVLGFHPPFMREMSDCAVG